MNEQFLNDKNPKVLMKIKDLGEIEIEIFESVAPITSENFLKLVSEGFYSGIIFHRVIKGFMIQGGDPTGTGCGGSKKTIKGEFKTNGFDNPILHKRGVISMARTMDPNSASSQFFIMHKDAPHLDGAYAAFGMVTKGIEVVDKIAESRTDYSDRPLKDIVIESAVIM